MHRLCPRNSLLCKEIGSGKEYSCSYRIAWIRKVEPSRKLPKIAYRCATWQPPKTTNRQWLTEIELLGRLASNVGQISLFGGERCTPRRLSERMLRGRPGASCGTPQNDGIVEFLRGGSRNARLIRCRWRNLIWAKNGG